MAKDKGKKDKDKDEESEEEEEGGGGGKNKIFMIVGGLVALGAVYNFVLKPAPEVVVVEATEPELVEGEIVQLDEMVLNLQGEGAGYLRIGVAVVLEEGVLAADFELKKPIAQDIVVEYLSAQSGDDLADPEFRKEVKEELGILMREAYDDSMVVRVLFTNLVMQ